MIRLLLVALLLIPTPAFAFSCFVVRASVRVMSCKSIQSQAKRISPEVQAEAAKCLNYKEREKIRKCFQ